MSKITLFDLPSKGRRACWSYNPWKIRLALNYKNLDYETTWLEYPDVESTLRPHVKPNSPPARQFTIPTIRLPSGEYVMDSRAIATRLEIDHPSPSLQLDSPLLKDVEQLLPKVMEPLRPVWMPSVPRILPERSTVYFERTRSELVGKPLQEYAKSVDSEQSWLQALPYVQLLGELVARHDGPFVLGKDPSYADFLIVGMLRFLEIVDQSIYNRVIEVEPGFGKLFGACQQWLERDGH